MALNYPNEDAWNRLRRVMATHTPVWPSSPFAPTMPPVPLCERIPAAAPALPYHELAMIVGASEAGALLGLRRYIAESGRYWDDITPINPSRIAFVRWLIARGVVSDIV